MVHCGPSAEVNTFRLHVIVPVLPHQWSYHNLSEDKEAGPISRVCLFPYLTARAGGLCWGSFFAHQQLPPAGLRHQHSSLSCGITCGYILLLGLDNSSPFIISQVPDIVQNPLVGIFREGLWWLQKNSCCFAVCYSGKKPSNDFCNV